MKNLFNFGFALKRIFSGEKKLEPVTVQTQAVAGSTENEMAIEAPLALTIWTIERSRYTASRALCTDIEVWPSAAVALCEDIVGYVIGTPNGESVVAEARTGSLVGHSLEVVRDGVREMTKVQLNNQLDTGKKEFNRMNKQVLSNDEFWKALRMGDAELEACQDY